ncbi:MAG: hypothetical protein KF716_10705 [Anaerolineae bacterium]|nr:hypothetical protein [Anaerolineae bacterium]
MKKPKDTRSGRHKVEGKPSDALSPENTTPLLQRYYEHIRSGRKTPAPITPDIIERLRELSRLRDGEPLSPEEYERITKPFIALNGEVFIPVVPKDNDDKQS